MKDTVRKVANKYGVSKEEVEFEIQKAIKEAMKSGDPHVQKFWYEIAPDGAPPKTEDLIHAIVQMVRRTK